MPKTLDEIAGNIMSEMEKLLLERVYIAILKAGSVLYASTALDNHIELLKLFNVTEFKQMTIFGHAFPLAGTNLAIFKILDDTLLALYTKKGYQGQLLSFKTKIGNFINELKVAIELPTSKPIVTEEKGHIMPKLVKTVSLTMGLTDDESGVLKLCDGSHSIKELIDKTRIPRKNVVDIIRRYEEKEWLKLEFKGEVEISPVSIKKFPETAVRLGMISKKSYDINELCDGNNTCREIADKLNISERELKSTLEKMEKNKIVKMTVKIPEEEELPAEAEVAPVEEKTHPELLIKPILTANVSFTMGFDEKEKRVLELLDGAHSIFDLQTVTQIPYLDIFRIIIKFEEKGWIRIPIDEFMHLVAIKDKLKTEYQTLELEAKYEKVTEGSTVSKEEAVETALQILEETPTENETLARETYIRTIQEELPLMPITAQNKLVDKLMMVSKKNRELMLEKLLNSESSRRFKKSGKPAITEPVVTPITPIPIKVTPPVQPQTPPYLPQMPITSPPTRTPDSTYTPVTPSPTPIIDESPLLRPSELLGKSQPSKPISPSSINSLIIPEIPKAPSFESLMKPNEGQIETYIQPEQHKQPYNTEILSKEIDTEEDKVSEVLNFIDSLLGIPEILYLALIDYNGTIFYQTTKEQNLWDITNDISKLVQNWKAQAPSVFLGDTKYATIKASTDMLIATNIKGFGHILAIPINDNLFLLLKIDKEGDALLIADDVKIVSKQINEMF
ncbi:MAG TPA: hypothetical protein VMV49_09045 [Candidatus Deferrimicrobium sp.]|nr:hypothetical protein [Candidatus Deferrimicrobium sp.]